MLSKPVLTVLLGGCLLAAAGGAYVSSRDAGARLPAETASAADLASEPVTETEAVVDEPIVAEAAPEQVPAASPAPAVAETPRPRPAPRAAAPAARRPANAPRPAPRPAPVVEEDTREAGEKNGGWTGLEETWPRRRPAEESVTAMPVVEAPPAAPAEPVRQFEELIVSADSVIGLQVDTTVTSERAQVEDTVEARVTRDVTAAGRLAIPAGTKAIGSITVVERGGKVKERARLGVRFHTLVLADGTNLPITTETIYREGASPAGESAAKIGGAAVGGAILGAIFGGAKGAVLGGSAGAGAGTAAVMAGGRNPATLQAGTDLTVRLSDPVTVTVEK